MTRSDDVETSSLERAEVLCDLERFQDAERLLSRVTATDPGNAWAWCLLARAQLGMAAYAAAIESAQRASALAPEDDWSHRLRSYALVANGQQELAVQAAATAVRLNPSAWESHVCLSTVLLTSKGRGPQRSAAAAKAVVLAPHEPEAHFAVAAAAAVDGRREDARAALARVLALDPQHSAAHHELARLNLNRWFPTGPKDLAAAARGYSTAVRTDPTALESRNSLDMVLRTFLQVLAYLIYLVAFVAWRTPAPRWLPLVLLSIPMIFALRFVTRLTPTPRTYLVGLITGRRFILAAAAELLAVLGLASLSIAPDAAQRPIILMAVIAGISGRLFVEHEAREAVARATGKYEPILSDLVLWVLAAALSATAALAILAAPMSSNATAAGVATVCLAAAALTIAFIKRRKPTAPRP